MKVKLTVAVALAGTGAAALLGGGTLAGAQQAEQAQAQQGQQTRQTPRSVTFRITPRTDRRRPWRFTVRGRVNLPPPGLVCPPGQVSGYYCLPLPRERACDEARVAIRYKAGRRTRQTISTRRYVARTGGNASQPPFCQFRGTVSFNQTHRLRPNGEVKVDVRFLGNRYYKEKSSARRLARAVLPPRR